MTHNPRGPAAAIIDDLPEHPDAYDFSAAKREIRRLVDQAIAEERERCARIVETCDCGILNPMRDARDIIAEKIRSGSE
jgi:hypothetical protein